jgi:hypothetical protein
MIPDLEFKIAKPEIGMIGNVKGITESSEELLFYIIK